MNSRERQAGFTLVEVLVVIAILGLVTALVVPNLIGHEQDARKQKARVDTVNIYDAATMFRLKEGRWPDSLHELVARRPPLLARQKTAPKDPWGNEYVFVVGADEHEWRVLSFGPDGDEGTGDDISSDM